MFLFREKTSIAVDAAPLGGLTGKNKIRGEAGSRVKPGGLVAEPAPSTQIGMAAPIAKALELA